MTLITLICQVVPFKLYREFWPCCGSGHSRRTLRSQSSVTGRQPDLPWLLPHRNRENSSQRPNGTTTDITTATTTTTTITTTTTTNASHHHAYVLTDITLCYRVMCDHSDACTYAHMSAGAHGYGCVSCMVPCCSIALYTAVYS